AAPGDYLQVDKEFLRLLAKDGTHWVVERGVNKSQVAAHAMGVAVRAVCSAGTAQRERGRAERWAGSVWWDFVNDPHGEAMIDDASWIGAHAAYRPGINVESGWGVRRGNIPEILNKQIPLVPNISPGFGGAEADLSPNSVQTHPSTEQFPEAPENEKQWYLDGRPVIGDGSFGGKPVRAEGTRQVFKYEPGTQANRPDWVSLARRQLPTLMTCGAQPLVDISGPETVLPDGPEGRYRYCVAEKPGECRAGSKTGELYFNCPYLETLGCTAKQGALDT